MTYECKACGVRWHVYMTVKGACPSCGSGTVRTNEPASPEAMELHRTLRAKGRSTDLHERFNDFYAQRERQRDAALESLARLPTREPPS